MYVEHLFWVVVYVGTLRTSAEGILLKYLEKLIWRFQTWYNIIFLMERVCSDKTAKNYNP